jgi:phosphohistidine phosphatase
MPALIVLRHAKADSPLGTPDFERPLTARGRHDARAVGDELRAADRVPERVICSPALRTRQTLEELRIDAPVDFEDRVYDNDPEAILDVLRAQPDEPDTLLLVGHNPSMHRLVLDLGGAAGEGFPTAATAVIEFDGDWSGLWPGVGRVTSYWSPHRR